jgi:hypothetical protein
MHLIAFLWYYSEIRCIVLLFSLICCLIINHFLLTYGLLFTIVVEVVRVFFQA